MEGGPAGPGGKSPAARRDSGGELCGVMDMVGGGCDRTGVGVGRAVVMGGLEMAGGTTVRKGGKGGHTTVSGISGTV